MDTSTSVISSSSTPSFPASLKDVAPQSFAARGSGSGSGAAPSAVRRRKPAVTYQAPAPAPVSVPGGGGGGGTGGGGVGGGGGLVDMSFLAHNTKLELEAAAYALREASMAHSTAAAVAVSSLLPSQEISSSSSSSKTSDGSSASASTSARPITLPSQASLTRLRPSLYPPVSIPRPPPRLYRNFTRCASNSSSAAAKPPFKRSMSITSLTSQSNALDSESGRRSSSRARRPAPKMRDTESSAVPESVKGSTTAAGAGAAVERSGPVRRRRGGGAGGRRRRTNAQQDADDSAYPATKRARRVKEKVEMEVDGEGEGGGAVENDATPPGGYSMRARKPKPMRADSPASDRSGSVGRTTSVSGTLDDTGASAMAM